MGSSSSSDGDGSGSFGGGSGGSGGFLAAVAPAHGAMAASLVEVVPEADFAAEVTRIITKKTYTRLLIV
jgi:hypothetical protein